MKLAGAGQILTQLGVPGGVVAIDNLLGGLMRTKRDGQSAPDRAALPLILENGRVRVGPVVLPVTLQPLY